MYDAPRHSLNPGDSAGAIRWNSLQGLDRHRALRGHLVSPEGFSYAFHTNRISLIMVKTSLVVILCVYGLRSLEMQGELWSVLSFIRYRAWQEKTLRLAGWVCMSAIGPLVLSAMILSSRSTRVSGTLHQKKGGAEEKEPRRDGIAITPPARGTPHESYARERYDMKRLDGRKDAQVSSLYTPPGNGGHEGADTTTPGRHGRSPLVTRRPLYSSGRTPPKTPIQDILHDFDAAADAAMSDSGGTPGSFMSMHHQTGLPDAMQQPMLHTYRPSAVQKDVSKTILSDGSVVSSQVTDRERVLAELGIDEDILERAMETLREWIACRLLQPLEKMISAAYSNVINSSKSIGIDIKKDSLIDLNDYGVDTSSKLSDQRAPLDSLLFRVYSDRSNAANTSHLDALKRYDTCIQSIITYKSILELLRGEYLHGTFLSSAPDGYILKRIKELANGTCMKDFLWNSGGESSTQRPWNNESPTDSALILYLFASFLAAPMWHFTDRQDQSKVEGPSDVLFLGKLPPRVSGKFTSILPKSLPQKSKGTAVQGLQMGTPNPHFSLSVEGLLKLTETGQSGLFRILVIFLFYVNQDTGALGNRSLEDLHLDTVVQKKKRFHFIDSLRKLHLW